VKWSGGKGVGSEQVCPCVHQKAARAFPASVCFGLHKDGAERKSLPLGSREGVREDGLLELTLEAPGA
jgi:hypothetical protein